MALTRLLVKRDAITECRLDTQPLPDLAEGEALAAIGNFALTANNISYALTGDALGYWRFFPADDPWGVVPVWGHARIIASRATGVAVGTQLWGFLPMASHLVMRPVQQGPRGLVDGATHREGLPAVYNQYAITDADPPGLRALADERSLLFPLFTTSYLIADYLADNALFGAAQVIIGSASSKTGFATAHYLRALPGAPRTIGLTSPGNIGFTQALGFFDRVVPYADIASLDASVPAIYVDMSGDGAVLRAVHTHFGDNLRASIGVGATHWEAPREREALPGPAPSFFFAPSQIAKRDAEWGAGELIRRANAANAALVPLLDGLLTIERLSGADAVAQAYARMVGNQVPPTSGLVLNFGDAA